jgi:phage terminase large subunit
MNQIDQFLTDARATGCPRDQVENFLRASLILQPRQMMASAAARLCDQTDGPTSVGYGGARGGGKSHWLLAQMGADDCQRVPGLKCLLLRKVGKSNLENFDDLRRRLFGELPHEFAISRGQLTFANGSRIIAGHFQSEKDIDAYLGLEYDVIGIEEATTLSNRKFVDITTCCRTSRILPGGAQWRPRIYSTTNPGGVGHAWYRAKYIVPQQRKEEKDTRFIPACITDNRFTNPEYAKVLANLSGWQKRAWFHGDWDIAAGQFFTNFRRDVHVLEDFDLNRARDWFCALDYGFTHYTVVLLGCTDADGNMFVVDEHAERMWLPQRHAEAIKAMLGRHQVKLRWERPPPDHPIVALFGLPPLSNEPPTRGIGSRYLRRFVAGLDVFSKQSDGTTIAEQYKKHDISLSQANMDRINGWAEIHQRLGDVDAGIRPTLFIHRRCTRLIECLPSLQHDPSRPEDVLKVDPDEEGIGGDDAADVLRYMVATKPRTIVMRKLVGF